MLMFVVTTDEQRFSKYFFCCEKRSKEIMCEPILTDFLVLFTVVQNDHHTCLNVKTEPEMVGN